jgi:hypothetical protein
MMRPESEIIEAYLLGRIGTICPFTDGLLVDAWECGFIHAMNANQTKLNENDNETN